MFVSHGCDDIENVTGQGSRPLTYHEYLYSTFSPITRHTNGSMHWCTYRLTEIHAMNVGYPVTEILGSPCSYLEGDNQSEKITVISRFIFSDGEWSEPINNSYMPGLHATPYISCALYQHKDNTNRYVLIAVNNYNKMQKFTLTLGELSLLPQNLDNILDDIPSIPLTGQHEDRLTDILTPFDVHIYMIHTESSLEFPP